MITSHIDVGQLLLGTLMVIVGWFIKREVTQFGKRLDRHERVIGDMTTTLSKVVGEVSIILTLFGGESKRFFLHSRENDRTRDEQ